jgi:sugar phosphate isomerase/epimerase
VITPGKIYVSTVCLPGPSSLEERLRLLVDHGLQAIELGQAVTLNGRGLSCLQDIHAEFLVHNYFPPPAASFVLNLASRDAEVRKRSLELTARAVDLCALLGAPFYSIHAGFITDPTGHGTTSFIFPPPESPAQREAALERFVQSTQSAMEGARRAGVDILVENNGCSDELKGKLLLQSADEFLEFFSRHGAGHPGILLDTGHLNVSAHTLNFDPMDFVEQTASHIRAFHVSANDGTADTGDPVTEGSWALEVLSMPRFSGVPVVVESNFERVEDLRRHVCWLRERLGRP